MLQAGPIQRGPSNDGRGPYMCGADGELGGERHSSGRFSQHGWQLLAPLRRIHGKHWNLKPICQLTGLHQR